MRKLLPPLFAAALSAACFLIQPGAAQASPSYDLDYAGSNKLGIDSLAGSGSASDLQFIPFGITGVINSTTFSFPIVGGAVDSATIILEAVSVGGFSVTDGVNFVTLTSPIVNTTGNPAIMTFLVSIDGNLQGRFTMFDLQVPSQSGQQLGGGAKVKIGGIAVTLSQEGATILNTAFSTGFTANQAVGTLKVKAVSGTKLPL